MRNSWFAWEGFGIEQCCTTYTTYCVIYKWCQSSTHPTVLHWGDIEKHHPIFHDKHWIYPVDYVAMRTMASPASSHKPKQHLLHIAFTTKGPLFRYGPFEEGHHASSRIHVHLHTQDPVAAEKPPCPQARGIWHLCQPGHVLPHGENSHRWTSGVWVDSTTGQGAHSNTRGCGVLCGI